MSPISLTADFYYLDPFVMIFVQFRQKFVKCEPNWTQTLIQAQLGHNWTWTLFQVQVLKNSAEQQTSTTYTATHQSQSTLYLIMPTIFYITYNFCAYLLTNWISRQGPNGSRNSPDYRLDLKHGSIPRLFQVGPSHQTCTMTSIIWWD